MGTFIFSDPTKFRNNSTRKPRRLTARAMEKTGLPANFDAERTTSPTSEKTAAAELKITALSNDMPSKRVLDKKFVKKRFICAA
jgi:hypothetical protein